MPYSAGPGSGLYPTWQGVLGAGGATGFVVGSYVAAERVRAHGVGGGSFTSVAATTR